MKELAAMPMERAAVLLAASMLVSLQALEAASGGGPVGARLESRTSEGQEPAKRPAPDRAAVAEAVRNIDCDAGESLNAALQRVVGWTTFHVRGTCRERVVVRRPGIRIVGEGTATIAPPATSPAVPAILIEYAPGAELRDLVVDYTGPMLSARATRPLTLASLRLASFERQEVRIAASSGDIGAIDAPELVVTEHSVITGGPRVTDVTVEKHSTADLLFFAISPEVGDLVVSDHSSCRVFDQPRWDRIDVVTHSYVYLADYSARELHVRHSTAVLGAGDAGAISCTDAALEIGDHATGGTVRGDRCSMTAGRVTFSSVELRDHSTADLSAATIASMLLERFSDVVLRNGSMVGDATCRVASRLAIDEGSVGTNDGCP